MKYLLLALVCTSCASIRTMTCLDMKGNVTRTKIFTDFQGAGWATRLDRRQFCVIK